MQGLTKMGFFKASIVAAFVAGISALASPAAAQTGPDYVFNVPVRIENATPLAGHPAYVRCSITALSADRHYIRAGEGRQNFDIGPTGFRGTVRVEVTLSPGMRRADSQRWDCTLEFYSVTSATGARTSWGTPNSAEAIRGYPALTGQAVRSSVLVATGLFTR